MLSELNTEEIPEYYENINRYLKNDITVLFCDFKNLFSSKP